MTNRDSIDRQAMQLFEQMLDLPVDEREAYLDTHCDDDAVRRKVLKMFAADDREAGLLDDVADNRLSDLSPVPERIGPYRIVETIGKGGMATVYRAQRADQDFKQTVALKLILPSRRTEHWESRFLQERQILASLQHPNIAVLLDGRTDAQW